MSLESQITALVSAASKLTSEVANKMSGIDQKVDQATEAVPEAVAKLSDRIICVDAVNGSDANSGDDFNSAKRTIPGALNDLPAKINIELRLAASQTHVLDAVAQMKGSSILARSYYTTSSMGIALRSGDDADRATIVQSGISISDGATRAANFRPGFGGVFWCVQLNFETATLTSDSDGTRVEPWQCGLFPSISSTFVFLSQNIGIKINSTPFSHVHASGSIGKGDYYITNSDVVISDLATLPSSAADQKLISNNGSDSIPFDLFVVNSTLAGAADWSNVVSANTDNVTTNLVF
ncbi:hypothetical protein [Vreelandella titanicae]|uniref:Uncharacterized protein n=1 Tax=Vreelandella titanicae TaxID=664683 RepID=A0AAP9NR67_9GAMM|nr:hypothetical protein [Halomonas titanicae]QKS26575.1 hypothetical protein FX987_04384 [Halomonas titanicae]